MDIKEYLQQKAEEDASSVLSKSDKEYCNAIALQSNLPPRNRYNRKFWVCISCAVCVLIAAIITIAVIFAPRKPIMYFEDNIITQASSISELNSDSKFLSISLSENTTYEVEKNYDSKSGDKLFYNANLKSFIESSSLIVVINKNYDYTSFDKHEGEKKEPLNGYDLYYYPASAAGLDGVKYKGWIKLKTETVYITYTQKLPLGDQAFFEYVQSVIQAK